MKSALAASVRRVLVLSGEPKSPCIGLCKLQQRAGESICGGCFRTTAEISEWVAASKARRQQILRDSANRARALS